MVDDWEMVHSLAQKSSLEKLKLVMGQVAEKIGGEMGKQIRDMLSPENAAIFTGVMALAGIASFSPGANLVVGGIIGILGYVLLGKAAIDVSRDLYMGVTTALDAQTQQDVNEASTLIARGLATAGVAAGTVGIVKLGAKIKNAQAEVKAAKERLENLEAPKNAIPNATRLSEAEQATAGRLQAQTGRTLKESEHVGSEYVDEFGKTYDQLGDPLASKFWNENEFLKSIDKHLLKSNDFTVVDLTGFTDAQITTIRNYINSLSAASQAKIIRIGF